MGLFSRTRYDAFGRQVPDADAPQAQPAGVGGAEPPPSPGAPPLPSAPPASPDGPADLTATAAAPAGSSLRDVAEHPTPADLVSWDDERYALWRQGQDRASWRAFLRGLSDEERELVGYRERRLAHARRLWIRRTAEPGQNPASRGDVLFIAGMAMLLALMFLSFRWLRFGFW